MNKNCITYWLPKLEGGGILVPQTVIVNGPDDDLISLLDGERVAGFNAFIGGLGDAARRVGGWPIFLRTGVFSAKHFDNAPRVERIEDLGRAVARIVEASHIADLMGLPTDVWAVRKFIKGDCAFHAFGGLPIRRERRYFIADGAVVAHIPYWPVDAFEGAHASPSMTGWRESLQSLSAEPEQEVAYLTGLSEQVAAQFEGAWSLDWMWDGEKWWAIDMALAHESWGCPEELTHPAT